jgi:YopT peptidase
MWISRKVHNLAHCIVASKVAAVRASALNAGGVCSWKFAQVENPVRTLMCSFSDTSIGICELLSAKWIEMHCRGSSLAAWLEGDGPIDLNKVRQLMQLYTIGSSMKPGMMKGDTKDTRAVSQDAATAVFLDAKGVVRRVGTVIRNVGGQTLTFTNTPVESDDVERKGKSRHFHACALADAVTENPNTHKTIAISGPHFAHALAAYTSAREYLWFDPNFGEFKFTWESEFKAWFPKYWEAAGYAKPQIGYSEMFKVREFVAA